MWSHYINSRKILSLNQPAILCKISEQNTFISNGLFTHNFTHLTFSTINNPANYIDHQKGLRLQSLACSKKRLHTTLGLVTSVIYIFLLHAYSMYLVETHYPCINPLVNVYELCTAIPSIFIALMYVHY